MHGQQNIKEKTRYIGDVRSKSAENFRNSCTNEDHSVTGGYVSRVSELPAGSSVCVVLCFVFPAINLFSCVVANLTDIYYYSLEYLQLP